MLLTEGLHEIAVKRSNAARRPIYETFQLGHRTFSAHLSLPAWSMVNPWEKRTPVEKFRSFPREVVKNRGENGLKLTEAAAREHLETAPFSGAESHAAQYVQLMKSIEKHGPLFDREPLPTVWLLTDGRLLRWLMGDQGNHRARIYAALGLRSFPARVLGLVDLRDLDSWPGCSNGTFHREDAERIFLRYLRAEEFNH
jgi:hypothetical protein